jgi:uncharacterized protein (TIGR00661 family)
MKILFAIQGTGNGHISRARDIIPILMKRCETDILVSGTQSDVELPFPVKYRLDGFSFIFGKKGGVDIWNTYVKANSKRLRKEIMALPVYDYDFVINDFEPVSAWACLIYNVPCVSLSHQSALLHKNSPLPKKKDVLGRFILRNYAPSIKQLGFHFAKYSESIYTPVIRKEIRNINNSDRGYYTVYLPAFSDDELIDRLRNFPEIKWRVFSKHTEKPYNYDKIEFRPINNEEFLNSIAGCTGILCGAGFETPAEALFLGKKLMVIPMRNQYEQHCNAASLRELGVPVIPKFSRKYFIKVQEWLESDYRIEIHYPDSTEIIINRIFEMYINRDLHNTGWDKDFELTFTPAGKKRSGRSIHKYLSKKIV